MVPYSREEISVLTSRGFESAAIKNPKKEHKKVVIIGLMKTTRIDKIITVNITVVIFPITNSIPRETKNIVAKKSLKEILRRILKQSPTVDMQTELDSKDSADSNIEGILDVAVTD